MRLKGTSNGDHGFSGKNMIGIITLMIIDIINKNTNDKQRIFIDVMIL